jgi:hypothetical protein
MDSAEDTLRRVGCPIRRSWDQRALASPPGFSQRATSFIASQCQGIHQMPFSSLHTAPNNKHPVPGAGLQEPGTRRAVPPDTATILQKTLPADKRNPDRKAVPKRDMTLRPRPRRLPPRSRTTRLFTLSISKIHRTLQSVPRMTSSRRVPLERRTRPSSDLVEVPTWWRCPTWWR